MGHMLSFALRFCDSLNNVYFSSPLCCIFAFYRLQDGIHILSSHDFVCTLVHQRIHPYIQQSSTDYYPNMGIGCVNRDTNKVFVGNPTSCVHRHKFHADDHLHCEDTMQS